MTIGARALTWWHRLLSLPSGGVRRVVFALFVLPFATAAAVLATRHWFPVLDLAMTELRVRDVFGRHTPLIGLPGRIGVFPDQGSHPGPLSFYLLTPVYRLVGSGAWGLLLAMIVLALVAIWSALWIAERRGGTAMVLAVGALLAVVVHGYGIGVLTQPWNPYLPLLFWVVVLLAAWSVALGDHAMIVVLGAAGSLCAQTHMPYLGLCIGLGGLAASWMVVTAVRHPTQRNAVRRNLIRAAAMVAVLWSPVVLDQVRNSPGNLSMLNDYFRNPPEQPVGLRAGVQLVLRHLDVARLVGLSFGVAERSGGAFVQAGFRLDGTIVPGVVMIALWVVSAVVALRLRHRMVLALDAVLAATLVLATVSMSRIFGKVWYYLTLWAWVVTILMVASILWTAFAWAADRLQRTHSASNARWIRGVRPGVAALLVVAAVGAYVPFVIDSASADVPEAHLSTSLRALVAPTAEAIEQGVGAADGHGGTYLVTWSDALWFGSQGYGLVSELERRDLHVGVTNTWRVPVTLQRVVDPATATAEIHLATGSYIDQWRAIEGVVEVAYVEPRDADERAEYADLDASLRAGLVERGLDELLPLIDTNLFGLQLDPRVSPSLQAMVNRLLVLGQPEAVFITPVGALPPSTP